jgi:hypothetical protein
MFVRTAKPKAAAAARIGAGLAGRKRAELLGLVKSCFVRTETWIQAGKYMSALVSEMPRRNGWTIAQHAGDRTPDRTQRLLNRAAGDIAAAMSQVRRFRHRDARPSRVRGTQRIRRRRLRRRMTLYRRRPCSGEPRWRLTLDW